MCCDSLILQSFICKRKLYSFFSVFVGLLGFTQFFFLFLVCDLPDAFKSKFCSQISFGYILNVLGACLPRTSLEQPKTLSDIVGGMFTCF